MKPTIQIGHYRAVNFLCYQEITPAYVAYQNLGAPKKLDLLGFDAPWSQFLH